MSYLTIAVVLCLVSLVSCQYTPDWPSLDSRPAPSWFAPSKFSLFMHFGLYSYPSYCAPVSESTDTCYAESYWEHIGTGDEVDQFHQRTYGKNFKYAEFAPLFTCELFDADEWGDLFVASGAKGLVVTSKHHEGFAMWPSAEAWNWNAYDVGPKRDLLGELEQAMRARGLYFGFYHSFYEWYNPLYLNNGSFYVQTHFLPMLYDLVYKYKPDVLYGDGEWDHDSDFWQTKPFLAWLFNSSPIKDTVLINDRWGNETRGVHGEYFICEYSGEVGGSCVPSNPTHPWTAHEGTGQSFGYNRIDVYKTPDYFVNLLIQSVAYGGHLELNLGPSHDGRIPEAQQNILREMGAWLKVNGDSIYGTIGYPFGMSNSCLHSNDSGAVFTCFTAKGTSVYAIVNSWPHDPLRFIGLIQATKSTTVQMLGITGNINYDYDDGSQTLNIHVPNFTIDQLPARYAWALELTNIANIRPLHSYDK